MGKGSARRPTDEEKFQANYDAIFGKVVVNESVPDGEVHFFQDGKLVGKIVEVTDFDCQHPETCSEPFCNCEVKHEST